MGIRRAIVIPDCHIPFHDEEAYNLMLDVARDIEPDGIFILGDFADFFDINFHGKDPGIQTTLKDEVYEVHKKLKQICELFPRAEKHFCQGNHEYRLERYIDSKCPELFDLVKTEDVLKLDDYGFNYYPYGPNQLCRIFNSSLYARHEPLSGGLHCAHGTVSKAMKSVIFGHTHRIQESQIVSLDGENFRGISSGWLGDKSSEVFDYVKNHHQWALGFSIVTVLGDGTWFNQLVHIIDYKCVSDGFVYEK